MGNVIHLFCSTALFLLDSPSLYLTRCVGKALSLFRTNCPLVPSCQHKFPSSEGTGLSSLRFDPISRRVVISRFIVIKNTSRGIQRMPFTNGGVATLAGGRLIAWFIYSLVASAPSDNEYCRCRCLAESTLSGARDRSTYLVLNGA